jgi:hypothetical protein
MLTMLESSVAINTPIATTQNTAHLLGDVPPAEALPAEASPADFAPAEPLPASPAGDGARGGVESECMAGRSTSRPRFLVLGCSAMAANYDEAVGELYRAPHDTFVAERKRLALELKATGDKPGAARLLKLGRPTLSAWAVNQLWWHAREPFEQLFAAGARLRAGDQAATTSRRDAIAALKSRAAALLVEGGHAVNEASLRRVTTTLSALAATGSFDPDPPGALAADRDPPGFDIAGLGAAFGGSLDSAPARAVPTPSAASATPTPTGPASATPAPATPEPTSASATPPPKPTSASAARDIEASLDERNVVDRERAEEKRSAHERAELARAEAEREQAEREQAERVQAERVQAERVQAEEAQRQRAEQEERRREVERAARRVERQRLEASLLSLQADLERRQREVERLRVELRRVEDLAEQARSVIEVAAKRLAELSALE